ncbi:MAG: hypothetical protein KU38_04965 [Sulfurovum sp. FS08-3]|nr:MAG: hypothetical protein KU38_04965 [Sulfurovum sp. FS08-3]
MISLQIDNPTIEQKLFDAIKKQKRDLEDIVVEAVEKFLANKENNTLAKQDESKAFQTLSNASLERIWDNQEDEAYDRFL